MATTIATDSDWRIERTFFCALYANDREFFAHLLQTHPRLRHCRDRRQGYLPLSWASSQGRLPFVQELLRHGSGGTDGSLDDDDDDDDDDDVNTRWMLLQATNKLGQTALWEASFWGHAAVVRELLKAGADVYSSDKKGSTAFHAACQAGRKDVVEMILEEQEATNGIANLARSWDGKTGLMLAVRSPETVRLLLENKANVNQTDHREVSALMEACSLGTLSSVDTLVKHDADLNLRDRYGNTALLRAIENGHEQVVAMLLERGADWTLANNKRINPLKLASRELSSHPGIMYNLMRRCPEIWLEMMRHDHQRRRLREGAVKKQKRKISFQEATGPARRVRRKE